MCSRGYRDKRELKKHQATHNHGDPGASPPQGVDDPPSPPPPQQPQQQQTVTIIEAPPQQPTPPRATVTLAAQQPSPKVVSVPVQQQQQPQNMASISFSLPTEPVPKNQLGLAPEPQVVQPQVLNPAQITLPPSVATALQSMNQKASKQQVQVVQAGGGAQIIKQVPAGAQLIQIEGSEGGQQFQMISGASLPPGLVAAAGNQPMFYYFMPSTAVQPTYTTTEGGHIRVAGAEGGAAQVFTLPAGAFQGSSGPVQIQVPVSGANMGQMQYIIDTSGQPPNSSGGRSSAI